jgi:hypothetical protein
MHQPTTVKQCKNCGKDYSYRQHTINHLRVKKEQAYFAFLNSEYCCNLCDRGHPAKAHELVRITNGTMYVDLTGKLTTNKDEAIVMHTWKADQLIGNMKQQGFKKERNLN